MALILSGTLGLSDVDGTAATPAIRGSDTNTGIFFPAADTIAFSEGGAEVARFDAAGNLGLGVTPSAWGSPFKALDINSFSSVFGMSSGDSATGIARNLFYDGSNWKYKATAAGSLMYQTGSTFMWFQSPSGTAGTTAPLTQAMTLTPSGGYTILQIAGANSGGGAYCDFYRVDGTRLGGSGCESNGDMFVGTRVSSNTVLITNGTERARIDTSGNLMVGTTSPGTNGVTISGTQGVNFWRSVTNATGSYGHMNFANPNGIVGSIVTSGSSTSYNPSSDRRLKENITPMTDGLSRVMKLKPVTYTWKSDGAADDGFIAQDLQEIPEFAHRVNPIGEHGGEMYYGVDYMRFVSVLTAAIQELKAIVDQQAIEIAALKGQA